MSLILYYAALVSMGMISLWSCIYTLISLYMLYYLNSVFGSILTIVSAVLFFKLIFLRGVK